MISSKKISDVLLKVYDFESGVSFKDHLLKVFEACIPATILSYAVTDLESGRMELKEIRHLRAGAVPPLQKVNKLMKHHPFLDYFIDDSAGPVLAIADLLSDTEWKRGIVYEQLHRPQGTLHDTSIRFYYGSKCISVHFFDLEPLDLDNRRLLTLISPHLAPAYRSYSMQYQGGLGMVPDHVVILDPAGHVLECTEKSRALLGRHFPGFSKGSALGLPVPVEEWVRSKAGSCSAGEGAVSNVTRKVFSRRGELSLEFSLHRGDHCMLLVLEERRVVRMVDVLLGYGLTPREAQVMIWVTQGKQNSEVATILDIRSATVRKHVEHILQKLHCETRGAAAQLVMNAISEGLPHAECRTCANVDCEDCSSQVQLG